MFRYHNIWKMIHLPNELFFKKDPTSIFSYLKIYFFFESQIS